jgi:glutathione S-transferase
MAGTLKLYYLPGSCALAPHIALEHAGAAYEAVRVERGRQSEPEYLRVNPLGRVPALVTEGETLITEVPAVLSYIADRFPQASLAPPPGASGRYQMLRWMAYFSSTVHPAFGGLWRSEGFTVDKSGMEAVQQSAAARLAEAFSHIDGHLQSSRRFVGDAFSAADPYLFVFCRWGLRLPRSTRDYPSMYRFFRELAEMPAVSAALAQQAVTLEGPASGPG